jgi:hypoxanthine phosphoribosyltransferase
MVKTVKLHDLEFMPYLSAAELDKVVYELSEKINVKYQAKTPLFVVVLNGAFMFASDLFKKVTVY